MKKIALCSLTVFLVFGNALGAECTIKRDFAVTNNNWGAGANEYLFPTERDYLDATNEANVWQCGLGNCADETYKCLNPGHTFKSNTSTVRKCYKCHAPWVGDRWWEEVSSTSGLTECQNKKRETGWFQDAEANEYLYPTSADYNSVKSRRTGQVYECDSSACPYGSTVTLNAGHYFLRNKINAKKTYKCVDGDLWVDITADIKGGDCPTCQKPKTDPKPKPKPNPKPGEPKPEPEPNPDTSCWYKFSANVTCSNGATLDMDKSYPVSSTDLNGKTCDEFKKLMEADTQAVLDWKNKLCDEYGIIINVQPKQPDSDINIAEVNNARDRLAKFFSSVDSDRSVWKNADGSFNAARLASDLTAGVVLGTVGGVVSGVLIKKSQVEKGFDALNCTVGGQKIADWGDEFRVGLRR